MLCATAFKGICLNFQLWHVFLFAGVAVLAPGNTGTGLFCLVSGVILSCAQMSMALTNID